MQRVIEKENNFKEPGERYRSWAPDRYLYCSIVIKYMDDIYVSCMYLFEGWGLGPMPSYTGPI